MATITITGNGHNSAVTLYKIHQGNCSFKKDTATFHSQVKLMQEALTSIGYNTQGANLAVILWLPLKHFRKQRD